MERYGAATPMENADVVERVKQTNLERYGSTTPLGNANVLKKMTETNMERHGVPYILCKDEVRELGHARLRDADVIDDIRNARRDTIFERLMNDRSMAVKPTFSIDEFRKTGCSYESDYGWRCKKCGTEFRHYFYSFEPRCPTCFPADLSTMHSEVQKFLTEIGIAFTTNDRKVIAPMELDILIQDRNIAIELDGLHWHSENNHTDRNYHLKKTELCKGRGLRLIHVFEDEWLHRRKIVKSRLRNLFGKNMYSIGGRKCEVREIDTATKNKFLEKYHIQGNDYSTVLLGSFCKGRLVAVMTFGDLRPALGRNPMHRHHELIRFCTIPNFSIIGIADKMLKHFERNFNPMEIISYADRRWSEGGVYHKLGFKLDHVSGINYWYFKGRKRMHRYNFKKSSLQGKLEKFDPSISEWDNMKNNGWDRIWDCGNLVFKKTYQE